MTDAALARPAAIPTGGSMIRTALVGYVGLCALGLLAFVPTLYLSGYCVVLAWPWVFLFLWPDGWWGGNLPVLYGAGAVLVTLAAGIAQAALRQDPADSRRRRRWALLCGFVLPLAVQLAFMGLYAVFHWESQFPNRP